LHLTPQGAFTKSFIADKVNIFDFGTWTFINIEKDGNLITRSGRYCSYYLSSK
jgi:hypothetical protein